MRWISAYLTGGSGWGPVDDPQWYIAQWAGSGDRVVWSVPILNDSGDTLEQGAAGAYDAHYLSMGKAFVAAGQPDAVFRLGWEFGGSYMPWSAGSDPGAFRSYWIQIVDTLRSIPGQHFQFDWNGGGGSNWDVSDAYPGNAYVDYVTGDIYDQSWDSSTGYGTNGATPAGYAKAWQDWLVNLDWMAHFATEHGKQLGFPEWGETIRSDGHGGGDDPYFIQQMYHWMTNHDVAYEMYFDDDAPDGEHNLSDGHFPRSAAVYRNLFDSGFTPHGSGTPSQGGGVKPPTKATVSCAYSPGHRLTGHPVAVVAAMRSNGCVGYWIASSTGDVAGFGDAPVTGSLQGQSLTAPIVAMAATPDGGGYWLAGSDGAVHAFGDAASHGSVQTSSHRPIVAMAATPDGQGYWLAASDGHVFAFGDASAHGSIGAGELEHPIVGIASSRDGRGYWLVAGDGGIFAFGNAAFDGSLGGIHLTSPVIGITPDATTGGYRLVARDGGVFSFDADFRGSLGGTPGAPVVAAAPTRSGHGYYLLRSNGLTYRFGSASDNGGRST